MADVTARIVTKAEEEADRQGYWMIGLFVVGFVGTWLLLRPYVIRPEWHKAIRLLVLLPSSLAGATVLTLFNKVIAVLLWLALFVSVVLLVIGIIWAIV